MTKANDAAASRGKRTNSRWSSVRVDRSRTRSGMRTIWLLGIASSIPQRDTADPRCPSRKTRWFGRRSTLQPQGLRCRTRQDDRRHHLGSVSSRTETEAPLRGRDELRAAWESQAETVGLRVEPQEVICLGADKVLADAQMVMRGGAARWTSSPPWSGSFTMPDDLVQKVELFETREEAMAAASAPGP